MLNWNLYDHFEIRLPHYFRSRLLNQTKHKLLAINIKETKREYPYFIYIDLCSIFRSLLLYTYLYRYPPLFCIWSLGGDKMQNPTPSVDRSIVRWLPCDRSALGGDRLKSLCIKCTSSDKMQLHKCCQYQHHSLLCAFCYLDGANMAGEK